MCIRDSFLNKPANIYANSTAVPQVQKEAAQPEPIAVQPAPIAEDENIFDMQLVEKPEGYNTPVSSTPASPELNGAGGDYMADVEEQKRRAAERIQKLRNLSFNVNNTADMNGEFDAVPAYVRRNMELFGNTLTSCLLYTSSI